jgi:hypothetical protein
MPNEIAKIEPPNWVSRVGAAVAAVGAAWKRGVETWRTPAPERSIGVAYSRQMASGSKAADSLGMLLSSPTVRAAVLLRAGQFARFPLRPYVRAEDGTWEAIDGDPPAWFRACMALLEGSPTLVSLAPEPGERLIQQIVADWMLCGVAWVRPVIDDRGAVVALDRWHPPSVSVRVDVGKDGRALPVAQYEPGAPLARQAVPLDMIYHMGTPSFDRPVGTIMGTRAGDALGPCVDAAAGAQTAAARASESGGVDGIIQAKSGQDGVIATAQLANKEARERLASEFANAVGEAAKNGRRALVMAPGIEYVSDGLKPAELQTSESAELERTTVAMVLGVPLAELGVVDGNFATASIAMRAGYEQVQNLAGALEIGWLRPMARFFALSDPKWRARAGEISLAFDVSSHPGASVLRTDALARAKVLVGLGWSPSQASAAEGLGLPEPEGDPSDMAPESPDAALSEDRPVGEGIGEDEPGQRHARGCGCHARAHRRDRRAGPSSRAAQSDDEEERARRWREIDRARDAWRARLMEASMPYLQGEAERYARAVEATLPAAVRAATMRTRAEGDDVEPLVYDSARIDWSAILGSPEEIAAAEDGYHDALASEWLASYEAAQADAAALVESDTIIPPGEAAAQPLRDVAPDVVNYSGSKVVNLVQDGIARGESVAKIADAIRRSEHFGPVRALRFGRTETTRSQSAGFIAQAANDERRLGIVLENGWLSSRDENVRDSHVPMDGDWVEVGQMFTLPSGVPTLGPGLSGVPGEDVNCRCALDLRKKATPSPKS